MIDGLGNVISAAQASPPLAASFKASGTDPASSVATGHLAVAGLSGADLDRMQTALATIPSWSQIPESLLVSIAAIAPPSVSSSSKAASRAAAADFGATFTDSCNSAGSAPAEHTAALVANLAQSVAAAATMAAPGAVAVLPGIDSPGPRTAFAVIWGILDGVYLGLAQTVAVSSDCATTAFGNTQAGTFPVDPNDGSAVVQGSSAISVKNVNNAVTAMNGEADTLMSQASTLNTTVNDIGVRSSEVQGDLQNLQTSVGILQNTEATVLNKANLEIANLSVFQQTQIRMEIEANLGRPTAVTDAVVLFQLPKAFGGYLETVKSIVTDTVAKQTAVSHGSSRAPVDLAAANTAFAAGHYKLAYQLYSTAYTDVSHA